MATLPTPEELAKEMLRILVRGRHMRADDAFMPQWLLQPFPRQDDRVALTDYALDKGWITKDCKLTDLGFAAAP